jgi:hypothetical protein
MARYTPASVDENEQWSSIVNTAVTNRQNLCKPLSEKTLVSALNGTYVALHELNAVKNASTESGQSKTPKSTAIQKYGFEEVRRLVRHSTNEAVPTSKKEVPTSASAAVEPPPHKEVATRNFFAPPEHLILTMILPTPSLYQVRQQLLLNRSIAPIVLTSAVNLIQLQKQLEHLVSENFEIGSTRNGTRVITRSMADFQLVKSRFDSQNLSYYSFLPNFVKPTKAVICHIPHNTAAGW